MKPYFLFPADPMDERKLDETFRDQVTALSTAGYNYAVVSLVDDTITWLPNYPTPFKQDNVVYRGWMLSDIEYTLLEGLVEWYGGKLMVSKEQYYAAHHLPNWYPLIEHMTPETLIFPGRDMVAWKTTVAEGWSRIQVKDYVKSLKTKGGSVIGSLAELDAVLGDMEFYRGEIEGGVCLRRWEEFVPGSERRYFVINGRYFGQEVSFDTRVMAILMRVAKEIPSPFFSVDIAQRTDGQFRVVEIGDGQVSDLVGWTNERFAEIWK